MGTKQNRLQNCKKMSYFYVQGVVLWDTLYTCKCYIIKILCYLLVCSNYLINVCSFLSYLHVLRCKLC